MRRKREKFRPKVFLSSTFQLLSRNVLLVIGGWTHSLVSAFDEYAPPDVLCGRRLNWRGNVSSTDTFKTNGAATTIGCRKSQKKTEGKIISKFFFFFSSADQWTRAVAQSLSLQCLTVSGRISLPVYWYNNNTAWRKAESTTCVWRGAGRQSGRGWMNKPSSSDDTLDQARRFLVAGAHSAMSLALQNQREALASSSNSTHPANRDELNWIGFSLRKGSRLLFLLHKRSISQRDGDCHGSLRNRRVWRWSNSPDTNLATSALFYTGVVAFIIQQAFSAVSAILFITKLIGVAFLLRSSIFCNPPLFFDLIPSSSSFYDRPTQ